MGKYATENDNGDRFSIIASRFQSQWDASGQIPQRLVEDGTITRFGAVDDTEGGLTSRTNIALDHTRILNDKMFVRNRAYFSKYDFELYSNFTFFLEDSVNGDQIRQHEDRSIYGVNSTLFQNIYQEKYDLEISYSLGLRYDDLNDIELSKTVNRQTTLNRLAGGDVDEANIYGFVNTTFDFGVWSINGGLRIDYFDMNYIDRIPTAYTSLSESQVMLSPKLNILYNPNPSMQLFVKSGIGFHSNDTRVVVAQQGREVLPAAYGVDAGGVFKPIPRLWINGALWYLFLEQEFVYVGDAGIVEPSGRTARKGVDLGMRLQLTRHLFFNTDMNYTHARSIDEGEGANLIPLAPELTAVGGLTYRNPTGFNASLRYRYIKDRPANEDFSIVAEGYFITDFNASYTWKNITIGVNVENLLDAEWNEAQFATESRLRTEAQSVEELHFTPGVPRFFKANVQYRF
jgi:outer membrane receptor for Fe3+-dicitrate